MLRLKRVPIDTYRENVAFLHRDCAACDATAHLGPGKIEVRSGERFVLATLNVVDNGALVGPQELGLSPVAFDALNVGEGAEVGLARTHAPGSQPALRAKIAGHELAAGEIDAVIADIVADRYSGREIAAFLVSAARALSDREVVDLARARAAHAPRLAWGRPPVVDKHSMGGIPGNRVTMVVVPVVAAHGLTIPKASSRAITSAAGTADTMEVLARVDLTPDEVRDVVARTGGCIVWNGRLNQSPVDDVMNSVTRSLALESGRLSVASILSKKLAAGATHVIIDMPVGPTAKVRSRAEAEQLAALFEATGDGLGMTVRVRLTDGSLPVGRGVGPALEARDVLQVLRGEPGAPRDLREKSLDFAAAILAFDPTIGDGRARAAEILDSGAAAACMERIIECQGPAPRPTAPGSLVHEVPSPASGTVAAFDNYRIATIARAAGAPMDKSAGIDLLAAPGERLASGAPLYRIHASEKADFDFAVAEAGEDCGIRFA